MKEYNLKFKGYWLDENRSGIPSISGIYLVYRCKYNSDSDTVTLIEILYIGQAQNLNERHMDHEKRNDFLKQCKTDETICYSVAEVNSQDLNVVENALIFAQKPPLNDKYKDNFNYDASKFHLEGRCNLMKHTDFTIK